MSQFQTLTRALLILLCITPTLFSSLSYTQALSYRQGELLIKFKGQYDAYYILTGFGLLKSRSTSPVFSQIEPLIQEWNVYKLHFDFSQYSEDKMASELRHLNGVEFVQKNHIISPRIKPNDSFFNRQWHHYNDGSAGEFDADHDADLAWEITTGGLTEEGDSIVVCVIDDGLDINHPDIEENIWINYSETPSNGLDDDRNGYVDDYQGWNTFDKTDNFLLGAHGTPVCGLIAAKGNNAMGVCGINWNIKLMFVAGGGDEANAIQSYMYPLRMRQTYNSSKGKSGAFVVAVNSSWGSDYGRPEDAPLWCAIYDSLGAAGILASAATSNQDINVDVEGDLPTTCGSDFIITVTNMNIFNEIDNGSAYGPKSIDIGAYGEDVFSIYPNNAYRNFRGTSAAAPQVNGAIALLYATPCSNLSALAKLNPSAAALEVKKIILDFSKPNADLKGKTVSGGVLNLFRSVNSITPLDLIQTTTNSFQFNFSKGLILPVKIQYRIKGTAAFMDTTLYGENPFTIRNLEPCTEYEIQYKGLCSRFAEEYSPIRIYKTIGCCEAPSQLRLISNSPTTAMISLQNTSQSLQIGFQYRLKGETQWDTIVYNSEPNIFILENLIPCAEYELRSWSFCERLPSDASEVLFFSTKGCENCSALDYCKRLRPQSNLEWLEAVTINSITSQSGNNSGFGNFVGSNIQWTLQKSNEYEIRIRPGYSSDSSFVLAACWIDFDQDGFFNLSENIISNPDKFKEESSFTFTIPADAKSGFTRMRVSLKFSEFSNDIPVACLQSLEFGEYEDYCVYITTDECQADINFSVLNVGTTSAQIQIFNRMGSTLDYAYRKLYENKWVFGATDQDFFEITELDSCNHYEIQLQPRCHNENIFQTKASKLSFNTLGTSCITGIETNDLLDEVILYPNPFTNQLHIISTSTHLSIHYFLTDLSGKILQKGNINASEKVIHLDSNLPKGLYILQIRNLIASKAIKLVKA